MGPAEEKKPNRRTQLIRALSPTLTMWFIWNTQMLSKGLRWRIGSLLPDSWVKKCALGSEKCYCFLPTGLSILRRNHVCGCSLFSSSSSSSALDFFFVRRVLVIYAQYQFQFSRFLMSRTSENRQQRPHVAATATDMADIGE